MTSALQLYVAIAAAFICSQFFAARSVEKRRAMRGHTLALCSKDRRAKPIVDRDR